MHKWKNRCAAAVALAALSALGACAAAPVKSNAAVCRIQFDYQDSGLEALNDQNLRALVAFKEVCQ